MLSIGEFSKICEVTTKTLRYYEEIGLLQPVHINEENGYRYYEIGQLQTMLFISRLKGYGFSLEEIREQIKNNEDGEEKLYAGLRRKKEEMQTQLYALTETLRQLDSDMERLQSGESMMSYLSEIDVQLVDVPVMCLLSERKMVQREDFPKQYLDCFGRLARKLQTEKLTMTDSFMVLFHSEEFTVEGMDTEFAVPVKEYVTGTRNFSPGLCIKTTLKGPYQNMASIYTRQRTWAEEHGYEIVDALFEMYVKDPYEVKKETELLTEIYCPVRKKR